MKFISDEEFIDTLKIESKNYKIDIDDEICNNLKIYKEMLIEWNEKINLTSITDNYEIIIKHFIDCMILSNYIDEKELVIDVGTGAGFPGMVLAIYFKGKLKITLLDSLNKRLIFLQEVKNRLNLQNVNIVHKRAEDAAHELEFREKYDVVVSRAVANLNNLLEYTSGYIKVNGKLLLMKGDKYSDEVEESISAIKILKCNINNVYKYKLNLDDEEFERSIIEVIKYDKTPEKYPRNFGQIKKKSL